MGHETRRYITLGSFDSYSLMLQFHDPVGGPMEGALGRVATSTLAHELVHLAHTLGTAAGVREFLMTVEDHQLRLYMLSRYGALTGDSEFVLPLLDPLNAERIARAEIAAELSLWASLQGVSRLYSGMEKVDEPEAESAASFWLQPQTALRGATVPWEVAHANLFPFTRERAAVLPGYRQLTEGPAKIVERIQRRLAEEQGEAAPAGLSRMELQSFVRGASSPYDPYYVAFVAFGQAKQMFAPESRVGGYEEYVLLLADLAMMIDPVTTPDATATLFGVGPDVLERMTNGYTPFSTYLRLCRLFWEHADTLPHLGDCDRMTEDVVRIQNALLAKVAPSLSMKALTKELRSSLHRYREIFSGHVLDDTPGIADLFVDSFDNALAFREETLDGGAFAEDFLTSREKLEQFARFLSPTYSVGEWVISRYEPHEGFGVGVDLTNLEMFRDLLDALFYGNRRCPLAGDDQAPRICALEPVSLCDAFPARPPADGAPTYCVREQTARLARSLGFDGLKWRH